MLGLSLESPLESNIQAILDLSFADIALAKKCIANARSDIERGYLFRCAIVTFYAALEGGTRKMCSSFIRHINASACRLCDLNISYANIIISKQCKFDTTIPDKDKQKEITQNLLAAIARPAVFYDKVTVESNLKPKVLKRLCSDFGFSATLTAEEEKDLDILLLYRNNIAHGDAFMPIDFKRIDQLSRITVHILSALAADIIDSVESKIWLNVIPA